jgi:hypothetical protein
VRDGQIVRYDDYMDLVAMARLLGRAAAGSGPGRRLTAFARA